MNDQPHEEPLAEWERELLADGPSRPVFDDSELGTTNAGGGLIVGSVGLILVVVFLIALAVAPGVVIAVWSALL